MKKGFIYLDGTRAPSRPSFGEGYGREKEIHIIAVACVGLCIHCDAILS